MRVVGLPETFWVVTSPTPDSALGDICFECDFARFALQIRGGLNEEQIVGIFANQQSAVMKAESLLQAKQVGKGKADDEALIHQSPWPEWFATQDSCQGVWICDKTSDQKFQVKPPSEWGTAWAWNITEDGTGIFIKRIHSGSQS